MTRWIAALTALAAAAGPAAQWTAGGCSSTQDVDGWLS